MTRPRFDREDSVLIGVLLVLSTIWIVGWIVFGVSSCPPIAQPLGPDSQLTR